MRRKLAVLVIVAGFGTGLFLARGSLKHKISAQELLREAVRQGTPLELIFEQQAAQGYYSDALMTAHLYTSKEPFGQRELAFLTGKVIQDRAENGDVSGAKEMVKQLKSELGTNANDTIKSIAFIQVNHGDLMGALETGATIDATNAVMEEYGERQIRDGDFDGALKTAGRVNERAAYDLFYDIGDALRQRNQQYRMHDLASHMIDRKLAAEFVGAARFTLWTCCMRVIQATPCDIAYSYAMHGNFTKAWALTKHNCGSADVDIALMEYSVSPSEAEADLARVQNNQARMYGWELMSIAAAKKDNISDALRFAARCQSLADKPYICMDTIQYAAWAWTLKGRPELALKWARSRPTPMERGYALLGMTQALGHTRPPWVLLPQMLH